MSSAPESCRYRLSYNTMQLLTRFMQIKNKEEYLVTCKVLESVNEMLHAGHLAELMSLVQTVSVG